MVSIAEILNRTANRHLGQICEADAEHERAIDALKPGDEVQFIAATGGLAAWRDGQLIKRAVDGTVRFKSVNGIGGPFTLVTMRVG